MSEKYLNIATRKSQNMMDEWTEHLILVMKSNGTFELGISQYEILGEVLEYNDEDTGDPKLPDKIDGRTVVGHESGYVIGGDLKLESSQYSVLTFKTIDKEDVTAWLSCEGWDNELFKDIDQSYAKILKSRMF
jgi:hypothetical protein